MSALDKNLSNRDAMLRVPILERTFSESVPTASNCKGSLGVTVRLQCRHNLSDCGAVTIDDLCLRLVRDCEDSTSEQNEGDEQPAHTNKPASPTGSEVHTLPSP